MSEQKKFSVGWDAQRTQRALTHCESRSEDEQVAEDEAAAREEPGQAT